MDNNLEEFPCVTCGLRRKAEQKPNSFFAKLWRWHTGWCPGWKAYQQALKELERKTEETLA